MNLTKTLSLLLVATAFLAIACKKNDTPAPVVKCKVSKAIYFDTTGARSDSATYTYTGDNITRATFGDGYYYTYDYTGDKVSKKTGFDAGSSKADYYVQITYNADGTITKTETFTQDSTGTGYELFERYEYIYNGGKISTVSWYLPWLTANKIYDYAFTYTGNNVTSITRTNYASNPSSSNTITYTYDTKPNYFKKQHAQIHLIDPFFGDAEPIYFPLAISDNNVTAWSVDGGTPDALAYSTDDKQNLKDLKINNQPVTSYLYQCQ